MTSLDHTAEKPVERQEQVQVTHCDENWRLNSSSVILVAKQGWHLVHEYN